MAVPSNIILTVFHTGYICGGANTVHEVYDAAWNLAVTKKNILFVLQEVFVGSAFGPT